MRPGSRTYGPERLAAPAESRSSWDHSWRMRISQAPLQQRAPARTRPIEEAPRPGEAGGEGARGEAVARLAADHLDGLHDAMLAAAAPARGFLPDDEERAHAFDRPRGAAAVDPLVEHPGGEVADAFKIELDAGNARWRGDRPLLHADRAEQGHVPGDVAARGAGGGGHVAGRRPLHGEHGATARERPHPTADARNVGSDAFPSAGLQDPAFGTLRPNEFDERADALARPFVRPHETDRRIAGRPGGGEFAKGVAGDKRGVEDEARSVAADGLVEDVDVDDRRPAEKRGRQVVPSARALDDAADRPLPRQDAGNHAGARPEAAVGLRLPSARRRIAPDPRQLRVLAGIALNHVEIQDGVCSHGGQSIMQGVSVPRLPLPVGTHSATSFRETQVRVRFLLNSASGFDTLRAVNGMKPE